MVDLDRITAAQIEAGARRPRLLPHLLVVEMHDDLFSTRVCDAHYVRRIMLRLLHGTACDFCRRGIVSRALNPLGGIRSNIGPGRCRRCEQGRDFPVIAREPLVGIGLRSTGSHARG